MGSPVAFVTRRNGAWMISWLGDTPADWPEESKYDCASSLTVAKRVAKTGAKTFATHLRWEADKSIGGWILYGQEMDEDDL